MRNRGRRQAIGVGVACLISASAFGTSHVGIGTSVPQAFFEVQTAAQNTDGEYFSSNTNPGGFFMFMPNMAASDYNWLVQNGDTGFIYTNNAGIGVGGMVIAPWSATVPGVGIRMTGVGNVGIGTTAATASLHIQTANSGLGFQLQDGSEGTANYVLTATDTSGHAEWQSTTGATGQTNLKYFTSSPAGGVWHTPSTTSASTFFKFTLVGGGGGGGSVNSGIGAGGGGGCTAVYVGTGLAASSSVTMSVGAAGAGVLGGNGDVGGSSSIVFNGVTITAGGGGGGETSSDGRLGGAGGTCSGSGTYYGVVGRPGDGAVSGSNCGGAGGSSLYGFGGMPVYAASVGNPGTIYGSGGGGANANHTGGNGAGGIIIVEWNQ